MDHYKIRIENIMFYAFHGCISNEKKIGSQYSVDLELTIKSIKALKTDSLEHTVNYSKVNDIVSKIMTKKRDIIESVANDIVDKILSEFPIVKKVSIKLSKIDPPISNKADRVSVIINKENDK